MNTKNTHKRLRKKHHKPSDQKDRKKTSVDTKQVLTRSDERRGEEKALHEPLTNRALQETRQLYECRDIMMHYARMFHKASPKKSNEAGFYILICTGATLGLNPLAASRHLDLVKGAVTLKAAYCRKLLFESGLCEDMKIQQFDTKQCTLAFKRKGEKESVEVTYTSQDAVTAGFLTAEEEEKIQKGEPIQHNDQDRGKNGRGVAI